MVFAGIVAGGVGSRMGTNIPKQFIELGGEVILHRTVRIFTKANGIDRIYIAVNPNWEDHTKEVLDDLISRYDIRIIHGGESRNDSIQNIISQIKKDKPNINYEDILVTHDAVRPFVTTEIIQQNIEAAKKYKCCTTAIPATDTILLSNDGEQITSCTDRKGSFQAQTPQTFQLLPFMDDYDNLTSKQKETLTDVCGVFTSVGRPIRIVMGDVRNIKITTPFDLQLAEMLLK
ncbi:MAG: 2-C-methyl-D-erythritol 4-phosphate cytidylyltransferase [Ruminococcus sp.]|nr:2-C-methyl-D-erythritol 4-phosphate cytidylyltransferase [Ruminococcus sp.]